MFVGAYVPELLSAVARGFAAYENVGCVTSSLELLLAVARGERHCGAIYYEDGTVGA